MIQLLQLTSQKTKESIKMILGIRSAEFDLELLTLKIKCRICSASAYLAERMIDNDGKEAQIYQCTGCGVLINESILIPDSQNEQMQSEFLEKIYSGESWSQKEVENQLETYRRMLDHLLEISQLQKFEIFVDVGSGSGFAAVASISKFNTVFATDLRIDIVKSNLARLDLKTIRLEKTLIPAVNQVDCYFLWHVLEHLKDPIDALMDMKHKLRNGGVIIFQVPLFRKENSFYQHYHFYNANTIRFIAELTGLKLVAIEFDMDLAFLTAILSKR